LRNSSDSEYEYLHNKSNFKIFIHSIQELKAIDASRSPDKDGLIIVNFGSVVNMGKMPDDAFNHFLTLFSKYPRYEFLWKFEHPTEEQKNKLKEHKNVHIKGWLNQLALLGM
jgi:hypothetical protein